MEACPTVALVLDAAARWALSELEASPNLHGDRAVATVTKWSGLEARALRHARRMSVREFAAHLGVNDAAVSNWERRGELARLRYQTQQILDVDLNRAPAEVRERFETLLTDSPAPATAPAPTVERAAGEPLGTRSTARTRRLLSLVDRSAARRLTYRPPADVAEHVERFLASDARALVITGQAGTGKTQLMYHSAHTTRLADVQLLSADDWTAGDGDLAVEILRYASIPAGDDALLALETHSESLTRACLVAIDSINSQPQLHHVAKHVDRCLRQVTTTNLRFVLLVRTPPEVDLSAYPVLAASVYAAGGRPTLDADSVTLSPWSTGVAADVWRESKLADAPPFEQLPRSIQQLARLPLYAQLVAESKAFAAPTPVNPAMLIEKSARALLACGPTPPDAAMDDLCHLAATQLRTLIPPGADLPTPTQEHDLPATPGVLAATSRGGTDFAHDVLREYFLARRIAGGLSTAGRPAAVSEALNELGEQARASSTARSVFELLVWRLDHTSRDLMADAVLSSSLSMNALTLALDAAAHGAAFLTADVLRSCVRRWEREPTIELARALLYAATTSAALSRKYSAWVLRVLRTFRTAIWADVLSVLQELDGQAAHGLLGAADLDDPEEATFFARFVFLFAPEQAQEHVDVLAGHTDWRVRVALADALRDERLPWTPASQALLSRLAQDNDYKVRAAAALALVRALAATLSGLAVELLNDENWHVRHSALLGLSGLTREAASDDLVTAVVATLAVRAWQRCPSHIASAAQRLLLLWRQPGTDTDPAATECALFRILREHRTRWRALDPATGESVLALARHSGSARVKRELAALEAPAMPGAAVLPRDVAARRRAYRALRDQRVMQVALDLHDVGYAESVATVASEAGAHLVEIGDPLIKAAGLAAVERIRIAAPSAVLVAEMMSADWGRDQVVLAAEAGADVVLLIGPASVASVSAAVAAGSRLGVPVVLDVPAAAASHAWVKDMERAGIDGFAITTNIDLGAGERNPLGAAAALRTWTDLPVAVSGGFSPTDTKVVASTDWDILVVGRSITEAVDPGAAARRFMEQIRAHTGENR